MTENEDFDKIQLLGEINETIQNNTRNCVSKESDVNLNVSIESTKKLPQYVAAISSSLSALSAGCVFGWTSPIMTFIQDGKYHDIVVSTNQMGWIGSFVTLGAMTMCIPTGFICDLIGRKKTLLLLSVPFAIGWILILFATSVIMLYMGRLILGMAIGACCIAVPLYTNEISEKDNKGALGSYFQLMITFGIFLAYLFGNFLPMTHYTVVCSLFPVLFLVLFVFQPESPLYLLKNGLYDEAERSLKKLRGSDVDVTEELCEMEGTLKESGQVATSIFKTFCRKSYLKALIICLLLMFFQQFSGINAVILYNSHIFNSAGVKLDPNIAAILTGLFQVIATFISSLINDKLGRKILLLFSCSIMTVSNLTIAFYFTLQNHSLIDKQILKELSFLPILALCTLVIVFSLGLGPIPWMISSELFPPEVKSIAGSAAGTLNWFLAFLITNFYLQLSENLGEDVMFYFFALCCILGSCFVFYFLPETKGKSVEEIQFELNS